MQNFIQKDIPHPFLGSGLWWPQRMIAICRPSLSWEADLRGEKEQPSSTYIYPYYFHRGKVRTSRPTLIGRLLLLPWLVYREYPPGAGRSPFTQQCIHSGMCGCRCRACGCDVTARGREGSSASPPHALMGDTPIRGPPAFTPCPLVRHQRTCSRFPDAFAPHRILTRLKVGKTIPMRAPGRPTAREKPVYRASLTAILTATAQLLAESFRLLPLAGCRTRLLRAWPHAYLWARRCPFAKHPLGC